MRKVIIIAALLVSAAPVIAQNSTIYTDEGQVVLERKPCSKGGSQAMFFGNSQMSGAAIGCWEAKDGYVYVHWTHLVGQNGSILKSDFAKKYPAPAGLR